MATDPTRPTPPHRPAVPRYVWVPAALAGAAGGFFLGAAGVSIGGPGGLGTETVRVQVFGITLHQQVGPTGTLARVAPVWGLSLLAVFVLAGAGLAVLAISGVSRMILAGRSLPGGRTGQDRRPARRRSARARIAWAGFFLALGLITLALTRTPLYNALVPRPTSREIERLKADSRPLLHAIERYKARTGRYPRTLAEAGLSPLQTRFGPSWYETWKDGEIYLFAIGRIDRNGFCLSWMSVSRDWYYARE